MSRARAKRIFGMTVRQWAVLGVLFLSIVCVLAGGLWWLNSIVASTYAGLNAQIAAVTPLPTATLTPTAAPTATASPTPIAYESLIPAGWLQAESDAAPGMEVWLPNSFVVPLESERDASYKIVDPADESAQSVVFLRDTAPSAYFIFTTFQLYTRPVFASGLDKMIDAQFADLMKNGILLERRTFAFQTEDYPARRLTFEVSFNGSEAGLAIYAIQVGTDVFYLGFTTPFNELYTRLPDFDRIVQTFRVVK
ncbi:MAG: hypothetical protein M5U11_16225 [Anaerolineales bacterium]|nr:hypothetical protein [Anaerolineales bacterium]MCZ7550676.1 hypothetical protein [Anaerolineales bacterium]MDX9936087.1 hypothetical protein [Anaerolineales bacterium]GER79414.1 conserved hypothetical protein [Candidatus Denitrolinea symbiosum]